MMRVSGVLAADQMVSALAAGLVAGLAVALPLGAVGVLLLQEGMTRGHRSALLGAAAVAAVDLVYAIAAVLAGTAVTAALAGRQGQVRLTSALVLGGLGLHGLWVTGRAHSPARAPQPQRRPSGRAARSGGSPHSPR